MKRGIGVWLAIGGCCLMGLTASAVPRLGLMRGVTASTDCFLGAGAIASEHVARAEVIWKMNALEITIACSVATNRPPRALGSARQRTEMFGGETLEVMIAPFENELSRYYHFAINASNLVYMAKGRDQRWKPNREVVIRQELSGDCWKAIFVIPFGTFSEPLPTEGTIWRAQFGAWRLDWCAIEDWHAPEQWGRLEFGQKPATAVIESVTIGEDGKQRIVFAVTKSGLIGHKGVIADDFKLVSHGQTIASRKTTADRGDAKWVTLDKYFYPTDEVAQIKWSAKGFDNVGTRATVRSLSRRDRVLELDDGVKRTSCQFELVTEKPDVARPLSGKLKLRDGGFIADDGKSPVPFFPVITSTEEWGNFTIQSVFDEWYARCPQGVFALNGAHEYYGAYKNLAKPPRRPLALYRLAYEIQSERRFSEGERGRVLDAVNNVEFYREAYARLKRKYPERLFSIHLDRESGSEKYADIGEVVEYASFDSSYACDMLTQLEATIDEARRVAGARSYIIWLGAAVPELGMHRTAEELNTGVRLAIMKGAAGVVFHNGHGGVPKERTRLWSLMKGIEAEVASWYPTWKTGVDVPLTVTADARVRVKARHSGGRYLLIAVNLGYDAAKFTYRDPVDGIEKTVILPGAGSVLIES